MANTMFGINFSSKLSGNTVICLLSKNKIFFIDVDEDVDADIFIYNAAKHFQPEIIFLNAPLSIPGVFRSVNSCCDHQYRQADKEICGISPMIIGGVTARAMELKQKLESEFNTKVYETSSKAQAENYGLLTKGFKCGRKELLECRFEITSHLDKNLMINCQDIKSWDHLNALLSLITAIRFVNGEAHTHGISEEGVIYV